MIKFILYFRLITVDRSLDRNTLLILLLIYLCLTLVAAGEYYNQGGLHFYLQHCCHVMMCFGTYLRHKENILDLTAILQRF